MLTAFFSSDKDGGSICLVRRDGAESAAFLPLDSCPLAGSGAVCRDPPSHHPGLSRRTGALEGRRAVAVCRLLWRYRTSSARDAARVRRSGAVPALSMAILPGAGVPRGDVPAVCLARPERHRPGRVLLGRLARPDADLWIPSNLRRQAGAVVRVDGASGSRDVCDLVRDRGPGVAEPHDEHSELVL